MHPVSVQSSLMRAATVVTCVLVGCVFVAPAIIKHTHKQSIIWSYQSSLLQLGSGNSNIMISTSSLPLHITTTFHLPIMVGIIILVASKTDS